MAIDTYGRLHIVYYDEQEGYYRPYYRTLTFTGDEHDNPIFGTPIPVADSLTSNSFTRPGEYMGIQLDSNAVPHIAWSDGRNNEKDIYYAHGIFETSIPLVPIVLLVCASTILVVGVVLYIRKHQRVNVTN